MILIYCFFFLFFFFFFNDPAPTEIYTLSDTLSLHDALPISLAFPLGGFDAIHASPPCQARSEEHTSELQSPLNISYAVFCLKKKTITSNSEWGRLRSRRVDGRQS